MGKDDLSGYYLGMIIALYGLQDDLDSNLAPDEAKETLKELIEICESDYRIRFGEVS